MQCVTLGAVCVNQSPTAHGQHAGRSQGRLALSSGAASVRSAGLMRVSPVRYTATCIRFTLNALNGASEPGTPWCPTRPESRFYLQDMTSPLLTPKQTNRITACFRVSALALFSESNPVPSFVSLGSNLAWLSGHCRLDVKHLIQ